MALIVQVPVVTSVTVEPVTVQIPGVAEVYVTVNPDEAVAPKVTVLPYAVLDMVGNVMVWLPFTTAKANEVD